MDPRQNLLDLIAKQISFADGLPEIPTSSNPRKSAVLILFGKLDNVMADPSEEIEAAITVPEDLDVLLLRRADGSSHHPGQIAFPGGGIDDTDADEIAAALREAQEETGLDPQDVEVLGILPEVPLLISNNLVTPVIGWWKKRSEVAAVDHTEAVEVFRAPVGELLDPDARATAVISRPPRVHRSAAFKLSDRFGGHIVWGFTGNVLAAMFDELKWSLPWNEGSEVPVTIESAT